ncbi:MAG: glycosyltransferase, partial [Candidatus Acidiferrum sp.]
MTTLALSMIVRDAAALLPGCLQSARGVVDEIFVADTGSTDNTMDVATRLGAQVVSIPWTNHFADARNRALAEVRSDWVLSLDADEQLGLRTTEQIRPLLEERDVSGYLVTIRNYVLSLKERVWDCAAKPNDSLLQAAK